MNKETCKDTNKTKNYIAYKDDKFKIEFGTLERITDTMMVNIAFKLKDERKTILKHQSEGLFEQMIYEHMRTAAKHIMTNSKRYKPEHILIVDVPQIIKKNNDQFNSSIELYAYSNKTFEFSFTTKDTIPQIQELENEILMDLLEELMIVLGKIQKIIEN